MRQHETSFGKLHVRTKIITNEHMTISVSNSKLAVQKLNKYQTLCSTIESSAKKVEK